MPFSCHFLQMVTRTKKIFVGGLSANTVVEDVKQYFEQFGKTEWPFRAVLLAFAATWGLGRELVVTVPGEGCGAVTCRAGAPTEAARGLQLNPPLSNAQGDSEKMRGRYLSAFSDLNVCGDSSKIIPWVLLLEQTGTNPRAPQQPGNGVTHHLSGFWRNLFESRMIKVRETLLLGLGSSTDFGDQKEAFKLNEFSASSRMERFRTFQLFPAMIEQLSAELASQCGLSLESADREVLSACDFPAPGFSVQSPLCMPNGRFGGQFPSCSQSLPPSLHNYPSDKSGTMEVLILSSS
ncbi:hypothetical protein H8958_004467 [Nasalis larvatus]